LTQVNEREWLDAALGQSRARERQMRALLRALRPVLILPA